MSAALTSCATTRQALVDAWGQTGARMPERTTAALQMVQAIAAGEGGNGAGCWGQCPGVCHNWGAVQLPHSPITSDGSAPNCPAGSAPCVDTHPTSAGPVRYGVCFKTYASQAAGAVDYLKTLVLRSNDTRIAVGSGNADLMAQAMYESHYYQGFSPDPATAIATYAASIARHAQSVALCMGEPVLVTRGLAATPDDLLVLTVAGIGLVFMTWAAWKEWGRPQRRRRT